MIPADGAFSRRWSTQTFNVKPSRLDAWSVENLSPTALPVAPSRAFLSHQQTRAPRKLFRSTKFVISLFTYITIMSIRPRLFFHIAGFFFSFLTYMYTPAPHRTEMGCL
jgi:hypothetical protein